MDKDWIIRLIIFAFGLLVIVGMVGWNYLQKRYRQNDTENDALSELEHSELGHNEDEDYEPDLENIDEEPHDDIVEDEEILKPQIVEKPSTTQQSDSDDTLLQTSPLKKPMIIQFSLVSVREEGFTGTEIFEVLDDVGLEYGNLQIFERLDARRLVDFGVANMVKPGIFPSTNLAAFHCPGLVFFMQPGKLDNPVAVFDDFVRTFQYVADQLGGEMKDHRREPLTDETIEQLRQSLIVP